MADMSGDSERSVLVIGAGAAGLAAARELRELGFSAKVIEARDRIGGRVWTSRALGVPVDLGGQWIHGAPGNPIKEIAARHQVVTRRTDYTGVRVHDAAGRVIPDDKIAAFEAQYDELLDRMYELAGERDGVMTVEQGIELALGGEEVTEEEERVLQWMVAAYQELELGVDASELTVRQGDGRERGHDELFPGGYDQIFRILAEGTDIHFNEIVQRIEARDDRVRVETSRGVHEAAHAVVTLPLGVLKKGSVTFSPPLSARKQGAIDRLAMGALNKIALRFPHARWPAEPEFFAYMSSKRGELPLFQNLLQPSGAPVLVAFIAGRYSDEIASLSDEEVKERVMKVLRTMFGEDLPDPTGMLRTHWERDPYAHGSYSNVPVGADPSDMDILAEPSGRVHFAGEATRRLDAATVHGALLSGIREAKRIAERAR